MIIVFITVVSFSGLFFYYFAGDYRTSQCVRLCSNGAVDSDRIFNIAAENLLMLNMARSIRWKAQRI